jgi:hypothetical protein
MRGNDEPLLMKSKLRVQKHGEVFTPKQVVKMMVQKLEDEDPHIFEKQLFGLAPSDIIFHIATNYIFSFDADNKISRHHFRHVDTRPAAVFPVADKVSKYTPKGDAKDMLNAAEKLGTWCTDLTMLEISKWLKVRF